MELKKGDVKGCKGGYYKDKVIGYLILMFIN